LTGRSNTKPRGPRHLLLLGTTFPDWLARFFIRIVKNGRLSSQRDELEIIADRRMHEDQSLVLFLRNFSYRTQIFEQGNAADFVAELAARYAERHGSDASRAEAPAAGANAGPITDTAPKASEIKPGSVFLSYAHQDIAAVRRVRDALEAAGIDVWFDQRHLEGGDEWDAQIKRHIRTCAYFVPVISAHTQARTEGYFRLEWDLALERSRLIADTIPFILPLAIDPVSEAVAIVPERFLKVQWTRFPAGEPTAEFLERMVRLIRDHRKRERGLL
jgi:nucleotide-binding universal stress UspA family protein